MYGPVLVLCHPFVCFICSLFIRHTLLLGAHFLAVDIQEHMLNYLKVQ